jgi:aerobic carbon-monoxide dehydrogenase medium subunit
VPHLPRRHRIRHDEPIEIRNCIMTPFELLEPASLAEAIALLDPDDTTVRPIAGGTAMMLMMKAGVFRPTKLVSLRKLDARYSRVAAGANGTLTIGAMTPLAVVERSPEVARAAPVIPRAMQRLSNIRVRNVATVGGNLAHGDPHMDLPPILIALGAEVAVAGPKGERTIAVEDLFAGYFETVLAKDELISELRIPAQGGSRAAYMKVTTGSVEDWPALGVAVAIDAAGARVKSARVVVSAATEKAVRLKAAEQALAGAAIDDKVIARAADAATDEAECISDVRGSAAYKRELLRVYVGRAIRQALDDNAHKTGASR